MFGSKLELLLAPAPGTAPGSAPGSIRKLALYELTDNAQTVRTVAVGKPARMFDPFTLVPVGEAQKPHEHSHALNAPVLDHCLGPTSRLGADQLRAM